MDYSDRLSNVAVLGAAGKMGSGITLLAALEMARLSLLPQNREKTFVLHAVDISHTDLQGLMQYLKTQILRTGEKRIVELRTWYAHREDLVENHDIIQQYLWDVMNIVNPSTSISGDFGNGCIFEAVSEDPEVKVSLLSQIKKNSSPTPWFFTNTSSIPIVDIDWKAGLEGCIAGLHFYNPPAVQKLVEVASADTTLPEVTEMAFHLAKVFGKKVAVSADVPGFIGNGHFMREIIHAVKAVEELAMEMPVSDAISVMNIITQDFLIRPMGIFQLIDYVGIDVCRHILKVMDPHFPEEKMQSKLLDLLFEKDLKGGQNSDGSQKPGFFKYLKGKPTQVYSLNKNEYTSLENRNNELMDFTGPLPASHIPWKKMISHPDKHLLLTDYFRELNSMDSKGAKLAKDYMKRSKEIAMQLVEDKVAESPQVVNLVMETGFFHAYGPINDFIK